MEIHTYTLAFASDITGEGWAGGRVMSKNRMDKNNVEINLFLEKRDPCSTVYGNQSIGIIFSACLLKF